MFPEVLSGTQRLEDPLPAMCLGHNCRGTGKPAPFCMQKAALTPSLPQASSSWQFRAWHSGFPAPSPGSSLPAPGTAISALCSSRLLSQEFLFQEFLIQEFLFQEPGARVRAGTDTRSGGRDRARDAYRRTGDTSRKQNCSSVTSQIITSCAYFFTLECLFCNQDIQVSASF